MIRRAIALGPATLGVIIIAATVALQPGSARADIVQLVSTLDGPQAASTCPGGSAGTGTGSMSYDTATNILTWNITFSGLSGPPIAAHFHGPAGPGVDAGIQVTISDLTSPSTGMSPSSGPEAITESDEADLLGGLWYINYHTNMCPGGEIRGQVTLQPSGVGGIAELPDLEEGALQASEGGGPSAGALVGIAAGAFALGATVLGAGVWYARRRVSR